MQPRVVRPSLKLVWCWYAIAAAAVIAGAWVYADYGHGKPAWLVALPAVLFVIPVKRHVQSRLKTLTIGSDRLTLERGLFSKYTRTIDLVKVQDVTVRQTLWERMVGIGDLSLETAGETGILEITGIDRPREISELILEGSNRHAPGRGDSAGAGLH